MTAVRIPPTLRAQTGDAKQVEATGSTVGEVISRLVEQHPALREQVYTAEGELNRFLNVYLNGKDVRYLAALDTPVSEADTLVLLPAMAGG